MAKQDLGAKEILVRFGTETCALLLPEGSPDSASALIYALSARFGLDGAPFYLTQADADASVVPLTSALPAGASLVLHVRPREPQQPTVSARTPFELGAAAASAGRSGDPFASALGEPLLREAGTRIMTSLLEEETQITSMTQNVQETVQAVDRMQRLSTDLANERTLLAWARTSLAAVRTVFPFLSLSVEGSLWIGAVCSQVGVTALFLVAAALGMLRYSQIKRITFLPTPPTIRFSRISIRWFTGWLTLATFVMAVCICTVAVKKLRNLSLVATSATFFGSLGSEPAGGS